jgi:homoserine dehydrogenase
VAGPDTLRKLRILSTLAFGGSVLEKDILCEGISSIRALDVRLLKSLGRKVKLLGEAKVEYGDFTAWVYPRAIPDKSSFYRVEGVDNSIQLDSSNGGNLGFQGPGAGMRQTASGVLTDVLDCILHTQRKESPLGEKRLQNRNELLEGVFYVRIGRGGEAESFPKEYVAKMLHDQEGVTCFLTEKMNLKKLRSIVEMQGNESFAIIAMD